MSDTAATREWARALVRSGLSAPEDLAAEVTAVLEADHPSLAGAASEWIAELEAEWRADATSWPEQVHLDGLQTALAELERAGFLVLQGCEDHWAARDALREAPAAAGVLWLTRADVWHAIDEPMLEINLWHPSGANAAEGDGLLAEVLQVMHREGLQAKFDEGRIEVPMLWRKRPE